MLGAQTVVDVVVGDILFPECDALHDVVSGINGQSKQKQVQKYRICEPVILERLDVLRPY